MNWLSRLLGTRPTPQPIDDALWQAQLARMPGLEDLPAERSARWRELTSRFLADKAISAGDCELSDADRVLIAMLCCEPVLDLVTAGCAAGTK